MEYIKESQNNPPRITDELAVKIVDNAINGQLGIGHQIKDKKRITVYVRNKADILTIGHAIHICAGPSYVVSYSPDYLTMTVSKWIEDFKAVTVAERTFKIMEES